MLFGPLAIIGYYICIKLIVKLWEIEKMIIISILSLISGLILLSLAPHQEARFLLPLSIPLIILLTNYETGHFKKILVFIILKRLIIILVWNNYL